MMYLIKPKTLTDIVDVVREKTGITGPIKITDINIENEEIASSINLPGLENPGSSNDLLAGKQLIDGDGEVVTGTFTIDSELNTQDNLIAQIQSALEGKAAGGGEQATPVISVSSNGLITATAGTKSSTHQLAFQSAKTITPSTTSQVAVSSGYYTGGNITVAGDANLVASNIVSGKTIFGVAGTATTGGGGDTSVEDGLITRTVSTYTNDRVTHIGQGTFAYCRSLTSVNFSECTSINDDAFHGCIKLASISFPKCTTIGSSAFYSCPALTSVNFPACTSTSNQVFYRCTNLISANFPVCTIIGNAAFDNCTKLASISFPACISISAQAFYNCIKLTSVDFPKCTTISSSAFYTCTSLSMVNFPVCTSIGIYAFCSCSNLTSVNFPMCTTIGSYAFNSCSTLTSVNFPMCTRISSYAFSGCTNLISANFSKCTTIGNGAFQRCKSLNELYLMTSSICSLKHSNAFSNAGITSTTGSIYVPASLLTSYQTATNWAYFSSRFVGI